MFTEAISLLDSATRTTSDAGAPVDLGSKSTCDLALEVTAASGVTPTLNVTIETSPDGLTGWTAVAAFAQATATTLRSQVFPGCKRYVRAKYVIAGSTPSFTFAVKGKSVLVYATPADVKNLSLPPEALAGFTDVQIDEACQKESGFADGYLGTQFKLPLSAWGDDLRANTADRAGYRLMRRRGFNPNDDSDQILVKTFDDSVSWLKGVAGGTIHPSEIIDATPEESDTQHLAEIYSDVERGW